MCTHTGLCVCTHRVMCACTHRVLHTGLCVHVHTGYYTQGHVCMYTQGCVHVHTGLCACTHRVLHTGLCVHVHTGYYTQGYVFGCIGLSMYHMFIHRCDQKHLTSRKPACLLPDLLICMLLKVLLIPSEPLINDCSSVLLLIWCGSR